MHVLFHTHTVESHTCRRSPGSSLGSAAEKYGFQGYTLPDTFLLSYWGSSCVFFSLHGLRDESPQEVDFIVWTLSIQAEYIEYIMVIQAQIPISRVILHKG